VVAARHNNTLGQLKMLRSRLFIWLELILVVIPTTVGAALLMWGVVTLLTTDGLGGSLSDALLWLVPVGTILGMAALWAMFFGIIKNKQLSQLVVYGFVVGVAVVFFTGASGFDSRLQSWWTLPILMVLNLGLPFVLVGCHWLVLIKKRGLTRRSTGRALRRAG